MIDNVERYLYTDDRQNFLDNFSKEKVLNSIRENGTFVMNYRIMIDGIPRPAMMRIAPFSESGETELVVSVKAL